MSQKQLTIILNIALVIPAALLIITRAHIFYFHLIFIILTFGALYWHIRAFIVSSIFWVLVTTVVLTLFVIQGDLHAGEIVEIPMLSIILLAVFLIARQRRSAEDALKEANQTLEARVVERTADLTQEIAERKQAEAELREVSALNQAVLDLVPDLFLFLDREAKLVDYKVSHDANPFHKLVEGTQKHTDISDVLAPDFASLMQHYITQTLHSGRIQVFEYQFNLDNRSLDCEVRMIVSGKDEVLAVIRDITLPVALERERRRTSRRLHDGIGQGLSFLHLKIDSLIEEGKLEDNNLREDFTQMRDVINESYEMVRDILATLQPSNIVDFTTALLHQANKISSLHNFTVQITSEGSAKPVPPITQHQALYLLREALVNIGKHAHAQTASIHVNWESSSVHVTLQDDGKGFDTKTPPEEAHYGLPIMHERAREIDAELQITSAPGDGTKVTLSFPI